MQEWWISYLLRGFTTSLVIARKFKPLKDGFKKSDNDNEVSEDLLVIRVGYL